MPEAFPAGVFAGQLQWALHDPVGMKFFIIGLALLLLGFSLGAYIKATNLEQKLKDKGLLDEDEDRPRD